MPYENVLYEVRNHVAIITLNNPEHLNAMSQGLARDFRAALDEVKRDPDVRVAITTGAGRAFCAGANLGGDGPRDGERTLMDWWEQQQGGEDRQFAIRDLGKPIIAAVNGYCLGRGLELALWHDIVYAADVAKLGMPEIRHGSMVASLIIWLCGMQRAKELILTGDTISAQEAERIGMVARVVPAGQLMEEAYRLARRIAKVPPHAVYLNKLAIDGAYDIMGLRNAQMFGHKMSTICHALIKDVVTADGAKLEEVRRAQGVRAFLAAREAPFLRDD